MNEHVIAEVAAALAFVMFVVTEALIFSIATLLLLKALLLERLSDFGRSNGRNNLAMALAYYVAFFSIWITMLRHPAVHAAIVVVVFATSLGAIREFIRIYGGWRGMLVEAGEATAELVIEVRRVLALGVSNIVSIVVGKRRIDRKIRRALALLALLVVFVVFVTFVDL